MAAGLIPEPALHVGNDRWRLTLQLTEPVDLLSKVCWQLRLWFQICLQSFEADCPTVQVVDIDAVAHDGTLPKPQH